MALRFHRITRDERVAAVPATSGLSDEIQFSAKPGQALTKFLVKSTSLFQFL
jgi:hypothetical protein